MPSPITTRDPLSPGGEGLATGTGENAGTGATGTATGIVRRTGIATGTGTATVKTKKRTRTKIKIRIRTKKTQVLIGSFRFSIITNVVCTVGIFKNWSVNKIILGWLKKTLPAKFSSIPTCISEAIRENFELIIKWTFFQNFLASR